MAFFTVSPRSRGGDMSSPGDTVDLTQDDSVEEGDDARAAWSVEAGTSGREESNFEAPDDQFLWRVSVDASQVMSERNSIESPQMQYIDLTGTVKPEPTEGNDHSQAGLGEDTDDDLEYFSDDEDDSDEMSSDFSDDDDNDESVAGTASEGEEARDEPDMTVAEMRAQMDARVAEAMRVGIERGRVEGRRAAEKEPPRVRKRRRRVLDGGQLTLDGIYGRRADGEDARHPVSPGAPLRAREFVSPTARRRASEPAVPEATDIPVPTNPSNLFTAWNQLAISLIPENGSIYSDFRQAFGDDTDEGVAYRRKEMETVGELLFQFKRSRGVPGQHAILKGREREGKTGALFSIALAACMLRMHVVILCAPHKVPPVVDMVKKLQKSGFGRRYYNVKHTLSKKATEDNGIPSAETGEIFVAALCTKADLVRVKNYIESSKRGGRYTVTLVDECDEMTQGKGGQSVNVPLNEDPSAYQRFLPADERGEDEDDVPVVRSGSRASRQVSRKDQIAIASKYFKDSIHPITQIIACSATLSGYILNPVGVFKHDVVTPIFQVYPKPGYRGIDTFEIPPGCELDTDGNLTLEHFQSSTAVNTLLRRFYDRKNVCDGKTLLSRNAAPPGPDQAGPSRLPGSVTLRGMLFISCNPKVYVSGGVDDIAKAVRNLVSGWGSESGHDPTATLFVCFIGKPKVLFRGKWLVARGGMSVEEIYEFTETKTRNGFFDGVELGTHEPLSKVCTHVVLIGYNLTRRAMTAAFRPSNEQTALFKIQYGILTSPKVLTIDAVSQRVNRPSHDFAEHTVPADYKVDVAMSYTTLELCKVYRKMEDEMVDAQRLDPKTHAVFRAKIKFVAHGLAKTRISKRNLPMSELSRTGAKQLEREIRDATADQNPDLVAFKAWLENITDIPGTAQQKLAVSTVVNYYGRVRQRFFNGDDVEEIEARAGETIERLQNSRITADLRSVESDELNALRYFVKWRRSTEIEVRDDTHDDDDLEDRG